MFSVLLNTPDPEFPGPYICGHKICSDLSEAASVCFSDPLDPTSGHAYEVTAVDLAEREMTRSRWPSHSADANVQLKGAAKWPGFYPGQRSRKGWV